MNEQPFNYRYDREEKDHVVRMLAKNYPKCFFIEPRLRRPLKRDIAADLQKDGFPVASELTVQAVEWYEGHYGYQAQVAQAGSKRIDLRGVEVGTVTEQEAMNARKRMRELNEIKNAQREAYQSPAAVLRQMHADRLVPDDAVKKLDAPPTVAVQRRSSTLRPVREFDAIYEALNAGRDALAGVSDPELRSAMTKVVLDVITKRVQEVAASMAT